MKIINRIAACLLFLLLAAFAATAVADNTYVFHYDGTHTNYGNIKHKFKNQNAARSYTALFKLIDTSSPSSDVYYAYCCDLETYIQNNTYYRRINLENATYFTPNTARKIRSVLTKGYNPTWTSEDLSNAITSANEWLQQNGYSSTITDAFSMNNAICATQMAIWYCANNYPDNLEYIYSTDSNVTTQNNIHLFRDYLFSSSEEQAPARILFSSDHFIDTFEYEAYGRDSYKLILRFTLKSPVESEDTLKLTATLGSRNGVSYELNGASAFQPDPDNVYTITFDNATMEEIEQGLTLSISGRQAVNSYYFYQPPKTKTDDPRDTSQNLVGYANGTTPIQAARTFVTNDIAFFAGDGFGDGSGNTSFVDPDFLSNAIAGMPKTGDAGILPWMMLLLVSILSPIAMRKSRRCRFTTYKQA